MTIDDLPSFVEEIVYDDEDPSEFENRKWFLALNRDLNGNWSCGYITWDGDGREMAVPQLVTNNSTSIEEAARRMQAKLERWYRRNG